MGFFDRMRDMLGGFLGRRKPEQFESEPESGFSGFSGIGDMDAGRTEPDRAPNVFDKIRDFFGSIAKPKKPEPESVVNRIDLDPFKQGISADELQRRRDRIYEFRRNTEEERHAFYRITQSIWDQPGVSAKDRDSAIQDYFANKYGIYDLNDIYDWVMSHYADVIDRYRNAPNAQKYEIIKNIRISNV